MYVSVHHADRAREARKTDNRRRSSDRRRARFQVEPLEGRQMLSVAADVMTRWIDLRVHGFDLGAPTSGLMDDQKGARSNTSRTGSSTGRGPPVPTGSTAISS
jgi:hypothetical protein